MMVYVDDTVCTGCGSCMEICPSNALIFQNNRAFIDQDLCRGCELCLGACSEGAILSGEQQPSPPAIVHMPVIPSLAEPADQMGLRDIARPALSSLLRWSGRELIPRLADAVLSYLDRRSQSSRSQAPQQLSSRGARRHARSGSRNGRGRGQRQRRCLRNHRLV